MSEYFGTAATIGVPCAAVGLFVGVVLGMIAAAWLHREDLRVAQRGVDEARAMLTAAGLWPPVPQGTEPRPADPYALGEEVSP
jgi:mannose/fructose/N-acetylgalactosamine-specific phosphotransferase system component IIC